MKRIIITPAQLRMINEESVAPTIAYSQDSSTQGVTAAVKGTSISNNNVFVKTPGTGSPVTTTLPELEKGIDLGDASGVEVKKDPTKTNTNNALGESRYTKRQVELGRMLEMRRTGKIYSKKQLNEMFLETQENAKRLRDGIRDCFLKDIFDAIEEVFPEEIDGAKEAFKNGADLPEYIITSIFGKDDVDSEREEEFLDILGL